MKKDVLFEIFSFLKSKGITATESEFSEHWLGASESYVRKLRSARTEPSLGAVAICASRLMCAAEQLRQSPRYRQLAEQMAAMSSKCRALVDAESVEFDLAA
ncbi:DUF6626 family protein [Novosphingobium sp. APW14]|uniref:DUF6626 family protein n=1 Tax=Novosphingobium sp. APW14 TaxID=3077237 RepID=UPI0028DF6C7E|nr:DUF6626 family protein [Novosphingobium sp. APW14]MDT9012602.1 DUF6626 family protein [Novosphingobium sp. APW14]